MIRGRLLPIQRATRTRALTRPARVRHPAHTAGVYPTGATGARIDVVNVGARPRALHRRVWPEEAPAVGIVLAPAPAPAPTPTDGPRLISEALMGAVSVDSESRGRWLRFLVLLTAAEETEPCAAALPQGDWLYDLHLFGCHPVHMERRAWFLGL